MNHPAIIWWINSKDTAIGNGGAFRHYKYNLEELPIPRAILDKINQLNSSDLYMEKTNELINNFYNLSKIEVQYLLSLYEDQ